MSVAILGDQPMVAYTEQYRCPACESLVEQSQVVRHPPTPQETAAGQRRVSVMCPHCKHAYRGTFRFSGGLLQMLAFEPIEDKDELADLTTRTGKLRGEIQREPLREPTACQVRKEKVARIKRLVLSGEYDTDGEALDEAAERLLDELEEQRSNDLRTAIAGKKADRRALDDFRKRRPRRVSHG
jgi:anti-sigma28 factor (negative regulator of flagellin synthesis)